MRSSSASLAVDQDYESQYNLRIRHPERGEIYTRYAQRSELTRQRPEARLDLRFGDRPSSSLDLFLPADVEAPPLLIFIHGGYWRALDKHGFSFVADAYLKHGVAVALPNYTLAPLASVREIVLEVCSSLAWLVAQGTELGYDARRIVVSGHSAGGHMAAAATCRGNVPELEGRLLGYVGLSGLFDLAPLLSTSVNLDLGMTPEDVEALRVYGRQDLYDVPMLLASGELETQGFQNQSADFARFCASRGLRVENLIVPGRNHFDILTDFAEAGYPLFDKTLAMLTGSTPGTKSQEA